MFDFIWVLQARALLKTWLCLKSSSSSISLENYELVIFAADAMKKILEHSMELDWEWIKAAIFFSLRVGLKGKGSAMLL